MAARLDRKERIVILVGIIVLALVCLVPPWERPRVHESAYRPGASPQSVYLGTTWYGAGYRPIFAGDEYGRIDVVRLAVQCAVVVLGTAAVVWFMRLWRKDQTAEKTS